MFGGPRFQKMDQPKLQLIQAGVGLDDPRPPTQSPVWRLLYEEANRLYRVGNFTGFMRRVQYPENAACSAVQRAIIGTFDR